MPRVLEFYQTEYYRGLAPVEGAREGVRFLQSQGHKLVIVTSTHESSLPVLRQSLDLYYPGCFREDDVHLTHHNGGSGPKRTKPEICQELGADILIDDHLGNLRGCREVGVQGILMRRPWNRSFALEELSAEGVLPAENWDQIVQHIEQTANR